MKKIATVTLLLLLAAVFALAGCGPSSTTETPSPSPTAGAPARENFIKAGDTYRILIWNNGSENDYVLNNQSARAQNIRERWEDYQQQYGITVTYIASPGDNWLSEAQTSAAAFEPMCDILHCGGPFTIPLLYGYAGNPGSILTALSDYAEAGDFSDSEYWDVSGQENVGTLGGKHYFAIPLETGFGLVGFNQVTFFNKDILQNNGYTAEDMYTMSAEGNWTFDKFRDIAKDCTNADKGIYGTLIAQNGMAVLSLITANGGSVLTPGEDGVPQFTADSDKSMKAINYFLDMCKNDKSVLTDNFVSQQEASLFKAGSVAMMLTYANRVTEGEGPRKGAIYQDETLKYGIVLPPKGPDAQDYMSDKNWSTPYSVFKGHENPAGVVQCLNLYLSPSYAVGSSESNLALETDAMTYFQDEESISVLQDILLKNVSTSYMAYWSVTSDNISLCGVTTYGMDKWINGESTPEVDYAANKDAVNSILSNLFNG